MSNFKEHLWPITPLSEMWGIGRRMERHLNIMGIYKVGDLANYNVRELKRRFGVIGERVILSRKRNRSKFSPRQI